jgi:hypothetical protein
MGGTVPDRVDSMETSDDRIGPVRSLLEDCMVITAAQLSPILSIVFGILILVVPRFLNYLVAIYLIVAGLLGLGILR